LSCSYWFDTWYSFSSKSTFNAIIAISAGWFNNMLFHESNISRPRHILALEGKKSVVWHNTNTNTTKCIKQSLDSFCCKGIITHHLCLWFNGSIIQNSYLSVIAIRRIRLRHQIKFCYKL
jgi:hypothetical protein